MKLQARNFVVRKPETIDITMFFKKFCIATRTKRRKNPESVGLTVIRNEITYQLLADGFRVHTKLPSDS